MPGAYARTSTQALTNSYGAHRELLANLRPEDGWEKQPALTGGINTLVGKLTRKGRRRGSVRMAEPPFLSPGNLAIPLCRKLPLLRFRVGPIMGLQSKNL